MWEYKRVDIKYKVGSEVDTTLNKYGEDGWEIVKFEEVKTESVGNRGGLIHVLFKRLKKETEGELLTD